MTINDFTRECYLNAQKLGWNEKEINFSEMIALIHSEASEALESFRNKEPLSWTKEDGKPEGIGSEFADIMIRIGHYAEKLGLDMEYECSRKLAYNLTRAHRHGDKVC